jgi:DNA-binding IclR family transcriptional regulator
MRDAGPSDGPIAGSSIRRALLILRAFSTQDVERGLSDLARTIGLPKASVHRIAQVLLAEGLLEQSTEGGPYRLGVRLLELARVVSAGLDVRKRSLPVMQRLCEQFGETVYLLVPRGNQAVCVERLEGTHMLRDLTTQVGNSLPFNVGAAPLAMLAHMPAQAVSRVLETPLVALTPYSCVDYKALGRRLLEIRKAGWSLTAQDVGIGAGAIAGPVLDHAGSVVAAISIGGHLERIQARQHELSEAVLLAANEASSAMGFSGRLPLEDSGPQIATRANTATHLARKRGR